MLESQIELQVDEEIYAFISEKAAKSKGFGARPLNRFIVSEIENKIADMMVRCELCSGDSLKIVLRNDKIHFAKECMLLK